MKKLLLILLMPMIGFGQCIKGDCENGLGLYFWPDGSYTNGSWKHGSPHGIIQKIDVHEGKLIKSFEKFPSLAPISIKLVSFLLSIKQRILIKSSYVDGDLKINFLES